MSKSKRLIFLILITAVFYPGTSLYAQEAPAANNRTEAKTLAARAVLRQAETAALRIRNDLQRDPLLDQIGVAEAKAGDLDAAVQTANQTGFPPTNTLREV
ncbi:MAG TPA: hypothetical protein VHE60_01960 [Pyrinomonadaceae bacterium]|nr:hypothetical protein [Pyrinomonadaceae bacterium]